MELLKGMTKKECKKYYLNKWKYDLNKEDIIVTEDKKDYSLTLEKNNSDAYTETFIYSHLNGKYYKTELQSMIDFINEKIEENNLQDAGKFVKYTVDILEDKVIPKISVENVVLQGCDILKEVKESNLNLVTEEEIKGYMYYYKNYSKDGKTIYIEKLTRGLVVEVYNNLVYKMRTAYGCLPIYYKY